MAQSDLLKRKLLVMFSCCEIVTVITACSFELVWKLPRLLDVLQEDHGLVCRTLGFVGFWYSTLAARETERKCLVGRANDSLKHLFGYIANCDMCLTIVHVFLPHVKAAAE